MPRRKSHAHRVLHYLILAVLVTAYTALAGLQPLVRLRPTYEFRYRQGPQPLSLIWPNFGEGAIGAVGYGVLATHGEQKPLPTASVIKVLTALAVLQQKPMLSGSDGSMITITSEDVASYNQQLAMDGSVVAVTAGEQISERQALEALLLPSANNMADTLARWAFGSMASYLTYANGYARQIGMASTTVTDPSGLTATTVSTPSDLVTLGEAALANPVIAAIVQEKTADIPVQGTIRNYNALLALPGIVGIKTGNNDADPGCFLLAAKRTIGGQPITIIGVLMNAPNLADALYQTLPLLYSAEHSFVPVTIATKGQALATYQVPWGKPAMATVAHDVTYVAWQDSTTTAAVNLDTLSGGTNASRDIGTLTIRNSRLHKTVSVPIVLDGTLPAASFWWRLTHPL